MQLLLSLEQGHLPLDRKGKELESCWKEHTKRKRQDTHKTVEAPPGNGRTGNYKTRSACINPGWGGESNRS